MDGVFSTDLEKEQINFFQAQGFLKAGRITTDEELARLRHIYDATIKRKVGLTPHELANVTDGSGPIPLISFISPQGIAAALKDTFFLRNARAVVARLLDVEETQLSSGWRLFFKPGHGSETPWHQDAAYYSPSCNGASVWMSLDPATLESGCMRYIKSSHLGNLHQHSVNGGLLIADDVDSSQAVMCPVLAGEAIVHHRRTLHGASSNATDGPRRALVVVCQVMEDG